MTRINDRQRRREATYRRGYEDGKRAALPASEPCECTKIEQDETCPIGSPSLLCEVCGGKGHVPYVKLDGPELWEIIFGANSDAAGEITDAQYDQIAKAINGVFIAPLRSALSATDPAAWLVKRYDLDGVLLDTELSFVRPTIKSTCRTDMVPLYTAPVAPSVAAKPFGTNKEMLTAFGGEDIREGSRMCFEANGEDTWENYYEVPFQALNRIRSALSAQVQDVAGHQSRAEVDSKLLEISKRLIKWDTDFPVNGWNGYAGLKELDKLIADAKVAVHPPAKEGESDEL